jgi:multisubunit Na+/H+ antiporter MnhC subunit
MSTETTLKMPKCCCCSVRTGLLIWIGISIIGHVLSIFRRYTLLELVSNGLGLLIALFGFYSCFTGKRVLVKVYGILVALTALISFGIGLFIVYSPDTKKMVEDQLKLELDSSIRQRINFDEIWGQVQMTMIFVFAISLGITCIILGYLRMYYKYLVQKEELESKPVIA